jgi:hypothetical protein
MAMMSFIEGSVFRVQHVPEAAGLIVVERGGDNKPAGIGGLLTLCCSEP